jgi:hypothetical protein
MTSRGSAPSSSWFRHEGKIALFTVSLRRYVTSDATICAQQETSSLWASLPRGAPFPVVAAVPRISSPLSENKYGQLRRLRRQSHRVIHVLGGGVADEGLLGDAGRI